MHPAIVPIVVVASVILAGPPPSAPTQPSQPEPKKSPAEVPAQKGTAVQTATSVMTPRQRLDATLKLYREAISYRDEGTAVMIPSLGRPERHTVTFTTAFQRGRRFRYEYKTLLSGGRNPIPYAVWSGDGRRFFSYMAGLPMVPALHGEAGATFGKTIPMNSEKSLRVTIAVLPMLRVNDEGEEGGWGQKAAEMLDPTDKGKEVVDGVDCWKIQGIFGPYPEERTTLFIGDDGLVRRWLRERTTILVDNTGKKFVNSDSTTIDFKPRINEAVMDDALFQRPSDDPPPSPPPQSK